MYKTPSIQMQRNPSTQIDKDNLYVWHLGAQGGGVLRRRRRRVAKPGPLGGRPLRRQPRDALGRPGAPRHLGIHDINESGSPASQQAHQPQRVCSLVQARPGTCSFVTVPFVSRPLADKMSALLPECRHRRCRRCCCNKAAASCGCAPKQAQCYCGNLVLSTMTAGSSRQGGTGQP
jgi:hypothetical protein